MVEWCLKLCRKFAKIIQIGNPIGKAASLISGPNQQEKVYSLPDKLSDISVWQLHNVVCSGMYGGAVINKENKIYSRFLSFPWGKELHPTLTLPFLGKKTVTLKKAIFLITPEAKGNYYHWVTDLIPRIQLIKNCGLFNLNDQHIILHHPATQYEIDTLSLLGISKSKIIRLNPFDTAEVQDLVVTDLVSRGVSFPTWKKQLLDDFKIKYIGSVANQNLEKIYLLRGNQRKRRLIGEEGLVKTLKELGFYIMDPLKMTLIDQIRSLASARIVVAPHGAALTNTIFCQKSTVIIELRSNNMPPEHYSEIAKTYGFRFEAINLQPEHVNDKGHNANKQNLVLTEESIQLLISKLQFIG